MKYEELRKACEMAGGTLVEVPLSYGTFPVPVWEFPGVGFWEGHKGLPAYVAFLLKDEIYSKHGLCGLGRLEQALVQADGATPVGCSPEELIRAAMEVLS